MTAERTDSAVEGATTSRRRRSVGEILAALGRPKVAAMLALGFSSGTPFLLIGATLGYWLREDGLDVKTIGFLSWVGLAYSLKFLVGPVLDGVRPPLFHRLGRRRGWMIWTQIGVAAGLVAMALSGPHNLAGLAAASLLCAACAASQDVAIDAWRIEIAENAEELGLLTSAYSLGFRLAIIATDALILIIAEWRGWAFAYLAFAASLLIGMVATLKAREPVRTEPLRPPAPDGVEIRPRRVFDAVIGPFLAFFRQHRWSAALILLMITAYHLSDYLRGPITNPYYHDIGLTKPQVAGVRATIGLVAAMAGIAAGGLFTLRFGHRTALLTGAVLQPLAVLAFAALAYVGPDLGVFSAVMAFDGFVMAFAGVALVAYMSTLTQLGYTATQYALLTSALAFMGKFLKGFSGQWVEMLSGGPATLHGYAAFFIVAALVGLPGLVLTVLVGMLPRGQAASNSARTS